MLGILVILAVSWLLLHFTVKKDLLVLGCRPIQQRLLEFFVGIIVLSLICLLKVASDTFWSDIKWQPQDKFSFEVFADSAWYYFKAVLTEDLVFRGALLYLLILKLGPKMGMIISAIAFGIYHWFSYGLLNGDINIVLLVYILLATGLMGFAWAYAYYKTGSLLMPLGMHFGWNQTQAMFYPNQPYGELLYSLAEKSQVSEGINFVFLLVQAILIPTLTMFFVYFYTKNKQPKVV